MLDNILTSGFEFEKEEYEQKLQYKFFNSMLIFSGAFSFLAIFVRLFEGKMDSVIANIIYLLCILFAIFLLRRYKNQFQTIVKFSMFFTFLTLIFAFYMQQNSIVGVAFFITFYIFVVFLTDKTFSYLMLIFSLVAVAYITYLNQAKGYNIVSVFFGFIPMIIGFVYLSFYEKRNKIIKDILHNKNIMLSNLTNNLQALVHEEVEKNKIQFDLLARQAQSAALGEMMDAIAHQWMQPLSVILMNMQSLVLKQENDMEITNEDIENTYEKVNSQVIHLTTTINEFRSFFRPNQVLIDTNLYNLIESTLTLVNDTMKKHSIHIEIRGDKDIGLSCIPNEFKHIFINLINNSKDAFIERNIENKQIIFEISKIDNQIKIEISDNAGGIPDEIIGQIFNSNFTTKSSDKGTGIGLYLSKQIINKLHGTIEAKNTQNGVCFTIIV